MHLFISHHWLHPWVGIIAQVQLDVDRLAATSQAWGKNDFGQLGTGDEESPQWCQVLVKMCH